MLSHPVTQFEMIKKSEEYLDMRLAGFDQSLLCLKNKTGHDILKTIHLETIIKQHKCTYDMKLNDSKAFPMTSIYLTRT